MYSTRQDKTALEAHFNCLFSLPLSVLFHPTTGQGVAGHFHEMHSCKKITGSSSCPKWSPRTWVTTYVAPTIQGWPFRTALPSAFRVRDAAGLYLCLHFVAHFLYHETLEVTEYFLLFLLLFFPFSSSFSFVSVNFCK